MIQESARTGIVQKDKETHERLKEKYLQTVDDITVPELLTEEEKEFQPDNFFTARPKKYNTINYKKGELDKCQIEKIE